MASNQSEALTGRARNRCACTQKRDNMVCLSRRDKCKLAAPSTISSGTLVNGRCLGARVILEGVVEVLVEVDVALVEVHVNTVNADDVVEVELDALVDADVAFDVG
eukprot:634263-Amphidinium_carterae.1